MLAQRRSSLSFASGAIDVARVVESIQCKQGLEPDTLPQCNFRDTWPQRYPHETTKWEPSTVPVVNHCCTGQAAQPFDAEHPKKAFK